MGMGACMGSSGVGAGWEVEERIGRVRSSMPVWSVHVVSSCLHLDVVDQIEWLTSR